MLVTRSSSAGRETRDSSCCPCGLLVNPKQSIISKNECRGYRLEGVWVFDDAAAGLVREPFISGADKILDALTECLPDAANGVKIFFSARPFPGYTTRFVWTPTEYEGNWYRWPERQMEAWLCPALLKYFETPPEEIFVQASPKSSGD
jgi:hypothetical protein